MTTRLVGAARSPEVVRTPRVEPSPRRMLPAGVLPVAIRSIGAALPPDAVDNDQLAERMDTDDDWIRTRTGIRTRHVAAAGVATSDLATIAATRALDAAGLRGDDLTAVVVATTTPDHILPATAPLVGARIGSNAAAFDLNAACSGFVYGLRIAGALAAADGPVLLVAAETMTRIVDPLDRGTAVLFGDGAAAVVLDSTGADGGNLGPFDLGADGDLADLLVVPAGGSRTPTTATTVADGDHWMLMRGSEVYRAAVAHMTESSQAVLDEAGLDAGDIDLLVAHQANLRIVEAVARRLGIPEDRCATTVAEHGNTSAASIPLALDACVRQGRAGGEARVLFTSFGAGLTWGSCLLTWQDPPRLGVAP